MLSVLDFAHGLVLRAVSEAPHDDHRSPALDDLVACKMVERVDGHLDVTELGQEVLRRSEPSRQEARLTRVLAVCVAVLAITAILGWLI
jgi:hypothetical protein